MKVAVYTIALNEAAHVERWANSALDADYRIVADTGSSDGTVDQLRSLGVTVYEVTVRPWRFDLARNAAMALIPGDVDVCCTMDMDRYLEPGWRELLEAAWTPGTTALYNRVVYRSAPDDANIFRSFPVKNFHHRSGYRFKRAVHEALQYSGEEVIRHCHDITMSEIQDRSKDTRRQYLPLMEVAHDEDPDDGQICFWLGREYMWAGRPEDAARVFQHYIDLPSSTWSDERSEAMRFLARVEPDKKQYWLERARVEAPHRREVWLDLAEHFHSECDWENLFWACSNGIRRTRHTNSYLDEPSSWGFRLHDLGAIASWRLNLLNLALEWGAEALKLEPENARLKKNLDFFRGLRGGQGPAE
jgi:glycosyltransferase involved in cell wall biosynthesis